MPKNSNYEELEKRIQELEQAQNELKQTQLKLRHRLEFERLISKISSELAGIGGGNIDQVINQALAAIGEFTSADRAYIFQFKNDMARMDNTHEWCAHDVEMQIENLQNISVDAELPWFSEHIRNREVFLVSDVDALPPEARLEHEHFNVQGIKSLIVLPIETSERLIGFLGFDAVRKHQIWSNEDQILLRFFSQTLSQVFERKRAESDLSQSKERFQELVEKLNDVIYKVDLNGMITYVSPPIKKILGYAPDALIQKDFTHLIHPDDLETVLRSFTDVLQAELSPTEFRIRAMNGKYRWARSSSRPIYENGRLIGVQGVLTDITNQKKSEAALRNSEEKLRAMFNASPLAIVLIDRNGKVLDSNEEHAGRLKMTRDQILGKCLWDLLPESVGVSRKMHVETVFETAEPFFGEDKRNDIWNEYHIYPAIKNKQNEIEAVIVEALNISERKKAQDELQKSEAQYRLLAENSTDMIWTATLEGKVTYLSPSVQKLFGYTQDEAMKMSIADYTPRETAEKAIKILEKELSLPVEKRSSHTIVEGKMHTKDGTLIDIELNATWLLNNQGDIVGIQGATRDITERKQAETVIKTKSKELEVANEELTAASEALQAREKSLLNEKIFAEALLECLPGYLYVYDDQGNLVRWNKKHETMTGYSAEELSHKNMSDWFEGEDAVRVAAAVEEVFATGYGEIEAHLLIKGGEKLFIHSNGVRLTIDGKTYFVGVGIDITERKQAEEVLRKLEAKQSEMISNISDVIGIIDTDGIMKYKSPNLEKWFGWQPQDLIGTDGFSTVHPDHLERIQKEFSTLLEKNNASTTVEYLYKCKDGSYKPIELTATNLTNNPAIAGVLLNYRDITERKKSEKALQKNKDRLESLWNITNIDEADTKIMSDHILSEVQKMTESRYAFYGFLGQDEKTMVLHAWSHETMADCSASDKLPHFPIDKAGIWADAVRERRTITLNDFQSDQPGKKGVPDGHVLMTRLMAVPLVVNDRVVSIVAVANKQEEYTNDDEKQVQAFMKNAQTIIDRKKTDEEKLELLNHLQQAQKMESIGNLAGGIAHDFNNILSSIIGFTELALDDVEKGSAIEDSLQEIFTAGKRARDLVKQILTFARQSEEETKPLHVGTIAKEILKFIRSSIPTEITIKQNINTDSLIMGNPTQIHQIIMNLCTNAAQAMENRGGILEVNLNDVVIDNDSNKEMTDLKPGDYLELTVSDTGAGIAPEAIDKIFEPYFTTKGPGEGTGMGLAMVHGIVESYGGKIIVNTIPGQGTKFAVYLPVIRKRGKQSIYEPEIVPTGTERILFVDDEAPIARMGSQILERLGYQVTIRTSSVEALELFRSKPDDFDLVISDMTMPNMTGDNLTLELIKIRTDIPVIISTGYSKKISEETASYTGIKALTYKPIVKADLAKTVRKVLDEAKKKT